MADVKIPLVKYQHIENLLTRLSTVRQYLDTHHLTHAEWLATEKIDGANLQWCTDGQKVVCASRSRILAEGDTFHNYQQLRDQYRKSVLQSYRVVEGLAREAFTVVRLYGEIFGGLYPKTIKRKTKDVKDSGDGTASGGVKAECTPEPLTTPQVAADIPLPENPVLAPRPVQSRVFYAPHVDFYLFDVSYETLDGRHLYLDADDVVGLARDCGFRHVADPLHRGTLDEMLTLDPAFPTTIPRRLGLAPLPGNLAEGYVLRLAQNPTYTRDTDKTLVTVCVKYKLKQQSFEETAGGAVVDMIRERVAKDNRKPKVKIVLEEGEQAFLVHILAGFTDNRIVSIMSKMDDNTKRKTTGKRLAAMLMDDVIEELSHDRDDLVEVMAEFMGDKDKLRKVKSAAFVEAEEFVFEYQSKQEQEEEY